MKRDADVYWYDPELHRGDGPGPRQMCSNCHKGADARRRKAFFSARLGPSVPGGRPHTLALCKQCLGVFIERHHPTLHLDPPKRRIRIVRRPGSQKT